jgi:carboxyl-terminal processing protease
MKKDKYIKFIFTISILLLFNFFNKADAQNLDKLYEKIDLFSEVLEKIQDDYVDDIDQSEVMDSAINGMLQSLDPYSSYMNPEIYENSRTETSGEFGGLGIEVSMESGVVKVIAPIDGTPAAKAGIKAGDYIVKIDNVQVQGKTLMEAVNLMRGPVDTKIELTVRRRGLRKAKIFTITRKIIEVKSVVSKLIDDKVGYLRLRAFNQNSDSQLKKEISKIEKNKDLVGYILDLRNNPGGLLSQAISISDFFLNDGQIVSTRGRIKKENRKFLQKRGIKLKENL